ncbi:MAG: hypothetical protein ACE5H9_05470 [Anaerolineae bacterium]
MVTETDRATAEERNRQGLECYRQWELEEAIDAFEAAIQLNPFASDYPLNLARARARFGDYEGTLPALAHFIRNSKDERLIERFEKLFGSAMDSVEIKLTEVMAEQEMRLQIIGAAIQMWLEYRITIGRRSLVAEQPEAWAAALDFTVRKINFREVSVDTIAGWYQARTDLVRERYTDLIETLDIMPCDYRYFRGEQNPLDKLVEAAALLEKLEARFRQM